jgi:mortality factor 4-like protein 1
MHLSSSNNIRMTKAKSYEVDETVLSLNHGLYYEAKILNIMEKEDDKSLMYFVHYQGWAKKWDEWVSADNLLKDNEEGREKKAQLVVEKAEKERAAKLEKRKREGASGGGASAEAAREEERRKKKKVDASRELEDDSEDVVTKFAIPLSIKKQLVDDYYNIQNKKIVSLPSKTPVEKIVEDYVASLGDKKKEEAVESAHAIKNYFNRALGTVLLYRFERAQFDELLAANPEKKACEVYGVEHLARLFGECHAIPFVMGVKYFLWFAYLFFS